ncbi:WG repeat-containing protein [bacterium]|nr:WG repeat-containing protein [bacterium]
MKKFLTFLLYLLIIQCSAIQGNAIAADVCDNTKLIVYNLNNKYGLKDSSGKVIVHAQYKKLIRLGKNAWIIQKRNKFGLINNEGEYLIKPKFNHVERVFDKYVKLGNDKNFGLYDEFGNIIIPPEFTSIEPLFGKKYVTCKNHKYGIYSQDGQLLLDNEYDFIYAPNPKALRIQYKGEWYEIEAISDGAIDIPEDQKKVKIGDKEFKMTKIIINTGVGAGYSVLTATDYILKGVSTISTAYEDTIDELMLSQGAETVSILMKLGWLPKFPIIYVKKYYNNISTPNKSPLAEIRNNVKEQMK